MCVCVCIQFCGPRSCPLLRSLTLIDQDAHLFFFSIFITGGGVTDGHGESKAGTRVHESKAVLYSTVSGRKGNSSVQSSGREKETLRRSSRDEVSVLILFFTHGLSRSTFPHYFLLLALFITSGTLSLILMLTCVSPGQIELFLTLLQ